MSFVRNRRTNKFFEQSGGQVKEFKLTSSQAENEFENQIQDQLITEFTEDLKTRLPQGISLAEKESLITEIKKTCRESLEPSFLKHITKIYASNALGVVAPLVTLFGSLIAPVAASAIEGLKINSGQPKGGLDLCAGVVLGCAQGYLTNDTEAWQVAMPQFSRTVQTDVVADKTAYSDYLTLRDCMTNDKMGEMVLQAVEAGTSSTKTACLAQSTVWRNYKLVMNARNLPSDACTFFQNNAESEAQACMSWSSSLKKSAIIGFSVTGAVLALAFCAYAARRMHERNNERHVQATSPNAPGRYISV